MNFGEININHLEYALLILLKEKFLENFQFMDGRPFLKLLNNLCFKHNLNWFNPFKHKNYSVQRRNTVLCGGKLTSLITL